MYSVKSSGNNTLSCNAGSTRSPPECPWVARKYRNCLEEFGFKQYWNLFFGPPPFCRQAIQTLTGHCEVPSNFALNFSIISSNRPAPSSSRGIDGSCRSNLIMTFDTIQQSLRNLSGLISIQFLSRTGIEMGDCVTVGFGRGFAFATGFPATLCSTFSREMVSDVSVTYLSIPFTFRTHDFDTVTFLMKADLHIQDRADFPASRGNVNSRHRFFISSGPSSSSVMKNCPFQQSSNQRRSTVWTISGL